ncbi:hypothetical protein APUTEX25_004578, partial [Auxenochlorella protothecoides]
MGVSMSAVRLNSLNILSTRSTEMIVAVECLTAGQTACTADANGNIGTSNKGKRNFGTRNTGDDNVGNNNTGTSNWGDNNRGKGNRCFDKVADRKEEPTHPDSRQEFATPNLTKTFPAPSILPSPVLAVTVNSDHTFTFRVTTTGYYVALLNVYKNAARQYRWVITTKSYTYTNTPTNKWAAGVVTTWDCIATDANGWDSETSNRGKCASGFISFPSVLLRGFSKAGGVRTTTLQALGLSMHALHLWPQRVERSGSTAILLAVECLKPGQHACTADDAGNVGFNNKGSNNFGNGNIGSGNIGNSNAGAFNWGDNNHGNGLRCFNCNGAASKTAPCTVEEFRNR